VADRSCIFFRRRPSTTLSAYSSTTVPATLPTARSTRAITTDDDEDDEDDERNRRLCCASARDGTAGSDMAITRVDSRGLVPGAGAYHPPITLQPPRCRERLLRSASRSIERPSRNVYRPSFIRAVIKRSAKAARFATMKFLVERIKNRVPADNNELSPPTTDRVSEARNVDD